MLSIALDMLLSIVTCFADVPWNGWPGCDFEKVTPRFGQQEIGADDGTRPPEQGGGIMRQRGQRRRNRDFRRVLVCE